MTVRRAGVDRGQLLTAVADGRKEPVLVVEGEAGAHHGEPGVQLRVASRHFPHRLAPLLALSAYAGARLVGVDEGGHHMRVRWVAQAEDDGDVVSRELEHRVSRQDVGAQRMERDPLWLSQRGGYHLRVHTEDAPDAVWVDEARRCTSRSRQT